MRMKRDEKRGKTGDIKRRKQRDDFFKAKNVRSSKSVFPFNNAKKSYTKTTERYKN